MESEGNPRHRACHILRRCGTPSVAWFEDALRTYGVPTVVFDLYLLVQNIEIAANVLEQNGWIAVPQQRGKIGLANLDLTLHPQIRLEPTREECAGDRSAKGPQTRTRVGSFLSSKIEPPTIVLLPAAEWNFDLDKATCSTNFLPSLDDLFDGLLRSLLDCSDQALQDHLNVQLAYLYGYAPELQDRLFAERLLYEYRQYHLDVRSGMTYGTLSFVKHQRQIREALRKGTLELQECSAPRNDESLFNQGVRARVRASLPTFCDEDA